MQGFVVQSDILQIEKDCKYQGIFRYRSWTTTYISNVYSSPPENSMAENEAFYLTEKYLDRRYEETGTFLCDDDRLVLKYAKALADCGDKVRVLFVQTPEDFDSVIPGSVFAGFELLGYDVIYLDGFYSAVSDDLYVNVPEPLQRYAGLLNANGIFSDHSAAREFLSDIDRCIEKGYDIEPSYGFDIVKLYKAVNINS